MSKYKYPFIAPCPILGCGDSSKDVAFQWYHGSGCGKKMSVTSNATLICEDNHEADMIDWSYKCSKHDYLKTSQQGILYSLNIMAQLKNIDKQFLIKASNKLLLQLEESEDSSDYETFIK